MSPIKDKKGPEWLSRLLALATDPKIIALVLAALGVGGGSGWVMADAGGVTPTYVDSVAQATVAPVKEEVESMRKLQAEMWGAMMDKDTAFREAVEARAEANQEAQRKRAETEKLFHELTGGSR